MAAGILDLIGDYRIEQGANYDLTVTIRYAVPEGSPEGTLGALYPIDNYTPQAHIRKKFSDPVPIVTFVCSKSDPDSQVYLALTPALTSVLGVPAGEYVWSLEMHHDITGRVFRALQGRAEIDPESTK